MKKKNRRKSMFVIVVLLILCGICWQAITVHMAQKTYLPAGKYVDAGAYWAHYYSKGEGEIAFVFITGSGTPNAYTDFYKLQNELSDIGQTITFDHAGSGWSKKAESKRSIENLVKELDDIINTAAPQKPVVLLCHSLGSLEAIGYAQAYPDKVAGIIFLDSGTPEFYSTDSEVLAKVINRATAFVRSVGLTRLLGECGILLPLYGEDVRNQKLPTSLRDLDKAMYYQFAGNPESFKALSLMNENALAVLEGPSLGNLPILVLSSDSGEKWQEVQIKLASWSRNSEQVTIQGAKHYLYWSSYDSVISYIDKFIGENLKVR